MFWDPRIGWHKTNFNLFYDCNKILDVGCGRGIFLESDFKRIIGIDRKHSFLKECVGRNFTVASADALTLPFKDQSFDGIYCAGVIEHFLPDDVNRLFLEMARVLKMGRLLVITTPLPSKEFWMIYAISGSIHRRQNYHIALLI